MTEQHTRNDKAMRQEQKKKKKSNNISPAVRNIINGNIDINKLSQTINDIKYNNTEDIHIWKARLNKVNSKKANQVLDLVHICNLNINNNKYSKQQKKDDQDFNKLLSTFSKSLILKRLSSKNLLLGFFPIKL